MSPGRPDYHFRLLLSGFGQQRCPLRQFRLHPGNLGVDGVGAGKSGLENSGLLRCSCPIFEDLIDGPPVLSLQLSDISEFLLDLGKTTRVIGGGLGGRPQCPEKLGGRLRQDFSRLQLLRKRRVKLADLADPGHDLT